MEQFEKSPLEEAIGMLDAAEFQERNPNIDVKGFETGGLILTPKPLTQEEWERQAERILAGGDPRELVPEEIRESERLKQEIEGMTFRGEKI